MDGVHHAGCARRLHAYDLAAGHQVLNGIGRPRDQSASADGHEEDVAVRQLSAQLQTDGALPGHDPIVVEGMDEGELLLLAQPRGLRVGVVVHPGHQHHIGTVAAGGLDLAQGRPLRNADGGGNAHAAGGKGHALCVVSGGAGDDAPLFLLVGEGGDLVVSPPQLEGARLLQAVRLQIKVAVGHDVPRGHNGGVVYHRIQDPLGFLQHFHR